MSDSILYIGDYGMGFTRTRELRLKAEIGSHGRHGLNGYKFHGSLTHEEVSAYLNAWWRPPPNGDLPKHRQSRSW